ncbi:MAG: 5-(carboxyamino)imidazole ribonucleotide synthase [Gammaproteobacteria bacterium]|jgi:5-(carboxyamino)imidazole ribonucleotide synthase
MKDTVNKSNSLTVGVLGGGQLGRMLALAGYPLGLQFVFYDRNPEACASDLGKMTVGEFDDTDQLTAFAQQVDLATVEFENIPLTAMEHVAKSVPVYPAPSALSAAQDRLEEKQLFATLEIPTPAFYVVDDAQQLADAVNDRGEPLIVKSRRFGYDGKGQLPLIKASDAEAVWSQLGGVPLVAEQRMLFSREVSLIAVRNRRGDYRYYPLTENVHQHGILIKSRVTHGDHLQSIAEDYTRRLMDVLDYVGVMAVEYFDCDGELFANEIAPRVHNSGHWTIEGAVTSQFENHLRAILDWPLGDTSARGDCLMYNLIGEPRHPSTLLNVPGSHLHYYGKSPRPGRKLGHVTLCDPDDEHIKMLEAVLDGDVAQISERSVL